MNRSHLWKLLFTLFLLFWSFTEFYPPQKRDLIEVFQREVQAQPDTNFTAIVARAQALQQQAPLREFDNLLKAAGTQDLGRYFPQFALNAEGDTNRIVLNRLQQKAAGRVKLGLDLQGGTSFLMALDTKKMDDTADRERAVEQAIEVLRKRVDRFGVAEPTLQPAGENRILVQLPGMAEAAKASARQTLSQAAFLEFRMVHPESDQLIAQEIPEPGYELLVEKSLRKDREQPRRFMVKIEPERGLTGKYVSRSGVYPDPLTGRPKISLEFNTEGANIFAEITRENVGKPFAIVLDGVLYSAPVIRDAILGGNCEISGDFTMQEAYELANVLQNPLEAPLILLEERSVDPSLGRDAIESGIKAALIGTIAVAIFMLGYYLIAGIVANVALMLNIVLLLGVMCAFKTTLTLPGIAGIVLTIGMAVDANVLIYERIREELAAGKSMRGALAAGYDRAFGTIFDSNLTTLIASTILIFMGTGPVKGFGVTLTIGVSVSMFTALVVTRLIFDFLLHKGVIKALPMLSLIRGARLDFMKLAVPAFAISWTLIVVGIGYGVYRGQDALGIDFRGGDQVTLQFEQQAARVGVDQLREAVRAGGLGEVAIQYQRDPATSRETLQITTGEGLGQKAVGALQQRFPAAAFEELRVEQVGAIVGREIQKSALVASLLALFGILIYVAFRYEFSFAVGAVVAVLHDILMTMGWFFLSGRELSAPIVAAVLTIIGFSINDTIVIFDRIREDLKLGLRGTFREIMNKALNQTLSRTIITSGTVFLSTVSLYLFGGGVINDFAFTFLVGILTGTYSSIYIASALVLWWHKGERPKIGAEISETAVPTAVPAKP